MKNYQRIACALLLTLTAGLSACGSQPAAPAPASSETKAENVAQAPIENSTGQKAAGEAAAHDTNISEELTYTGSMELTYAKGFAVDYYEKDYALITVAQDSQYLLVPEGGEVPGDLPSNLVILQQPLDQIYLVSSAVMDMFISLDALDSVGFTALKEEDWYLTEAKEALRSGAISYAGKYSAPDYEQIISGGSHLAIENTMIYHTPEIKEQLERFGIPVMVDYSSYEAEPLGRTEWVKLYGLLTSHSQEAEEAFDRENGNFEAIRSDVASGKSVAYFYITGNGQANVRKSTDYMAKMIQMAGGDYIFSDLGADEDSASSSMTMTMEEFYASAKDVDYIIYNSTIDGELDSVKDLLGKSELLANFKAVKEGHVFCTTKNIYQSSMSLGTITADIHYMLADQTDALTYLYQLN